MHGHLFWGETPPRCSACQVESTVEHRLPHCLSFTNARSDFISVTISVTVSIRIVLESRQSSIIIIIKANGFYRKKFECLFLTKWEIRSQMRSTVYIINSTEPRNEPCGTPQSRWVMVDRAVPRRTYCVWEYMTKTTGVQSRWPSKSAANDSVEYRGRWCWKLPTGQVEWESPCPLYRLLPIASTGLEGQWFQLTDPTGARLNCWGGRLDNVRYSVSWWTTRRSRSFDSTGKFQNWSVWTEIDSVKTWLLGDRCYERLLEHSWKLSSGHGAIKQFHNVWRDKLLSRQTSALDQRPTICQLILTVFNYCFIAIIISAFFFQKLCSCATGCICWKHKLQQWISDTKCSCHC